MIFRCPCGEKEMSVADEKLAEIWGKEFPCPVCDKTILLDPANALAPARFKEPQANDALANARCEPQITHVAPAGTEGPELEPEMIRHGVKSALVAVSDLAWRQAALEFFRSQGYHCLEEADPARAVQKLHINAVDAALVEDLPALHPVITEIIHRPGFKRRETCLMLLGQAKSMDSYTAFLRGADWMVHTGDIARAADVLGEMLTRQEASRELWVKAESA